MCTLYDCSSLGHSAEAFVPFHEFAAVRSCFSSALSLSSSFSPLFSCSSSPRRLSSSSASSSPPVPSRHCLRTRSRSNWTRGRKSVSLSILHPHPSLKPSAKSIDIGFASFWMFFLPSRFFTEHPHCHLHPHAHCHFLHSHSRPCSSRVHPSTGDTSSASDDLTRDSACTIKCSTNGLIMLMAKVRLVILLSLMLFVPSNVTASSSSSSADVSEIRNGTLFTVTSIRINTAETGASETNQLQGMCNR